MPSDKVIIYRSTHPDVLAAVAKYKAEYAHWRGLARELLAYLGFEGHDWWIDTTFGAWSLAGVVPCGNVEPPPGWKFKTHSGQRIIAPDRRYKAGREAAVRLAGCKPPDESWPGMPSDHLGAGVLYSPGLQEMDGAIWVTWPVEVPEAPAGEPGQSQSVAVDLSIWERARRSAFYAAVEAREAAS